MSISASLSNALSGLTAASRAAELVSSNVANAMTEGYARRELQLSPRFTGGMGAGVQVDGVTRVVDEVTLRERRLAEADADLARAGADFYRDLLLLVGEAGEEGSLTDIQASFEASLIEAVSRPESEARLADVVANAGALADKMAAIGTGIQDLREDADRTISAEVDRLNASLVQISDLNAEILRLRATDASYPDLLDRRQSLIDEISALVPIRQLPRDNGTVALYSMGGALLLDATPATFGFRSTAPITADMTTQSGALSALTINGEFVDVLGANAPLAGGRLAGLFEVRDDLAVGAQSNIDEVARDLVSRFEAPGPDPTLAPGDAGLFTDAGASLDPSDVTGLSFRLTVNPLADPAQGGALWRLRDGLGAAAPGPIGDGSILSGYVDAISAAVPPVGGSIGTAARSLSGFAASLTSAVGQSLSSRGSQMSFATARLDSLRNAEAALGVDTDQEMQKLLLIEQAYAANARVVQTVDELIETLIGL